MFSQFLESSTKILSLSKFCAKVGTSFSYRTLGPASDCPNLKPVSKTSALSHSGAHRTIAVAQVGSRQI